MVAKVFSGALAMVQVNGIAVGVFESVNYGVNLGAVPIHLLGRYAPSEIVVTSYEAISVACSGFRIVDNGVHTLPKFPKLQDLLTLETVTLSIVDRLSGKNVMTVVGCVPISHSESSQAKAESKFQITYLGVKHEDESGSQQEVNAVDLP